MAFPVALLDGFMLIHHYFRAWSSWGVAWLKCAVVREHGNQLTAQGLDLGLSVILRPGE